MAENPLRSKEISDVLDLIGLSTDEVHWRRKMISYWEFFLDLQNQTRGVKHRKAYWTGSRIEGVGLDIVGSDLDVMQCRVDMVVIHKFSDWKFRPDLHTYFADTTYVHPGYCHLRLLNKYEPTFATFDDRLRYMSLHNGNAVINTSGFCNVDFGYRHGPAITYRVGEGVDMLEDDLVFCIRAYWPPQAVEWLMRVRHSNFPPPQIIKSAENEGAHVVPIGHKESSHQEIEWRFSFSFLELVLIKLWPNNALKCFFLLKVIKTELIEQSTELSHASSLCTYHLKTLMFWLTEETGVTYWNEHSLLECLVFTLKRLICMMESFCIPHYFIRENNLFDIKANMANLSLLVKTFHKMFSVGSEVVSSRKAFELISHLCKRFHIHIQRNCIGQQRLGYQVSFVTGLLSLLKDLQERSLRSTSDTDTTICQLRALDISDDSDLSASINYIIESLRSSKGAHIISLLKGSRVSNATCHFLCKVSEKMMRGPIKHKAARTKLANFYYITGKYEIASKLLMKISKSDHKSLIKVRSFLNFGAEPQQFEQLASINSPMEAFANIMTTDAVFAKTEIFFTPRALQYEFFKMVGKIGTWYEHSKKPFMDDALVDPDVLMYYLQYLCYTKMGKQNHARVALDNLDWIVRQNSVCLHRETALNILGDCYLKRGNLRRAKDCFVIAFNLEPKFTTAPVRLALVILKALEKRRKR